MNCSNHSYQALLLKLSMLLFTLSLSYACEDDACERLNCQNGGICIEGGCSCPEGYAGLECELELDPCLQISCNNGTCVTNAQGEARCVCDNGFEGTNCENAWTDKFFGDYIATEVCNGGSLQYKMSITNGLKFSQVTFENFHNKRDANNSAKVVADLLSTRAFEIPGQFMNFGYVTGSGSINQEATELTFNFSVVNNSDTLKCAILMKRE